MNINIMLTLIKYISLFNLLIYIVENESTPIMTTDNDEIEGSFSDEDAEEDQLLIGKGKSKRRDKYWYYSSKLFYVELKMMKTI